MKHLRLIAPWVIVGMAIALGACSTPATDKLVAGVDNFVRGLKAVDAGVKQVNATIYSNCNELRTMAGAINEIAGSCSKASDYTSVANVVIANYCQRPTVEQAGIAQSLAITASSVTAAKNTLAANKKACGS